MFGEKECVNLCTHPTCQQTARISGTQSQHCKHNISTVTISTPQWSVYVCLTVLYTLLLRRKNSLVHSQVRQIIWGSPIHHHSPLVKMMMYSYARAGRRPMGDPRQDTTYAFHDAGAGLMMLQIGSVRYRRQVVILLMASSTLPWHPMKSLSEMLLFQSERKTFRGVFSGRY